MNILDYFVLPVEQWIWFVFAALLVGFSKTAISGGMMLVIPIIAWVFGGKESTGIILPMLIVGDIFAVKYYNRHADWGNIRKLLPWTLVGLLLGVVVGRYINDQQFKILIAISVIICLIILIYSEVKGDKLKVPNNLWLYSLVGIASGFTSMIGNAAGPIFSIYLLARAFNKNTFLGTTAWFFLILNLTKLPMQVFFWHNITLQTIVLDIIMIPAILLGAMTGIVVIKKINEKPFRYIIIAMTAIAAARLVF
jgi:uncharacterized protein